MKREIAYIGTILLALLLASSCGKDKDIEQAAAKASTVTLGIGINNGTSRAGTVTIPDGYKLRYILEVLDPTGLLLPYHQELTSATGENVEFSFTLAATGDYKALLWADFIPESAQLQTNVEINFPNGIIYLSDHYPDNHYYTRLSLYNVSLIRENADYIVNDPTRDAFFGSVEIKKGVGAYNGTVTLTRPFGQLNLVEKNTTLAATMTSATLTYDVPHTFNVETGTTDGTATVSPTVSTPAAGSGLLLTDYIFAPAAPGQTTLGEIVITFESNAPAHLLDPFTVPANTPVARNRRTNVTGTILRQSDRPSNDATLSITVSDTWDTATGDIDTDIDLYIPDANFRAYCIRQGYADANGYIIKEKTANVPGLNVGEQGIASLKGIEYFTGLAYLYCYNNQLTGLDVTKCTRLTSLFCYNNRITTLDVKGCTGLTDLSCSDNLLTELDVTGCTRLTELSCYGNLLTKLDVTGCTRLKQLSCSENQITELDVKSCTGLTRLSCEENQLNELDVTKCTGLTYLYCNNNRITTLTVKGCSGLTNLNCYKNQLSELDVTGCTGLTELSCYGNQITKLDMKSCTGLTRLSCHENLITELDVKSCTRLTYLECNSNQLTELDVKSCTRLTYLDCYSNQLTELDVKSCTGLTSLYCFENLITELDVTKCTGLTYLHCYSNRIATLDATNMAGTEGWQLLCGNQTTDGSAPRSLALTLRADQQTRWKDVLSKMASNTNVNATYP